MRSKATQPRGCAKLACERSAHAHTDAKTRAGEAASLAQRRFQSG